MPEYLKRLFLLLLPTLVTGITLTCYLPALSNGFVDWDDFIGFVDNPQFRGLSGASVRWMFTTLHMGHYQPLSWLSLGLDDELWGMNPAGFHFTSILLHSINAALVYQLARRLLPGALGGSFWRQPLAAAISALFFSLHPLRVESVAWATQRHDVLSGVFFLLTLLAWLRWRENGLRRDYVLSLALFVLALLSKATTVTLPPLLLLLEWIRRQCPEPRDPRPVPGWPRMWGQVAPFFALAVPQALMASHAAAHFHAMDLWLHRGFPERAAQAAYGLIFYPWKTLWPAQLSPLYELEPRIDPLRPVYLASLAGILTLTLLTVVLRKKWPMLTAAWLAYALMCAPVLGFMQSGPQKVADRYSYLSCIPWALLLGFGWLKLPPYSSARMLRQGATLVLFAWLILLAVTTQRQLAIWRDSLTLWTRVVQVEPASIRGRRNLQKAAARRGLESQLQAGRERLAADPGNPQLCGQLGEFYVELGEADTALPLLETALSAEPGNPRWRIARGRGLEQRNQPGDLERALDDYDGALAHAPDLFTALDLRAGLRLRLGRLDGALTDYAAALRLRPEEWMSRANYGVALARTGRIDEARAQWKQASLGAPRNVQLQLEQMDQAPPPKDP